MAGRLRGASNPETGEWVPSWDTSEEVAPGKGTKGLPPVIEVTLWVADAKGNPVDFSTRVDLPLYAPPTPTPPH